MRITSHGNVFYGHAPRGALEFPENGWKWLSAKKVWMTVAIQRVIPLIDLCDAASADVVRRWQKGRADSIAASVASTSTVAIPAPPGLLYRPYQLAGASFMLGRHSSLNADVPRLGKTIQSLAVANHYARPLKIFVGCPALAKINWCREATKWLIHQTTIGYCDGSKNPETDFLVCNYDIIDRHMDHLLSTAWDIVIFDEAHMLKNPRAKRTMNSLQVNGTLHRLFLTGTPIFTRPIDIWPIVERCDPEGLGRKWFSFVKRYCDAHKNGFAWDTTGSSHEEELQLKMRQRFMVRREKADVLAEIPPNRQTVYVSKKGLEPLLIQERTAFQTNLAQLIDALNLQDADAITGLADHDGRGESMDLVTSTRRQIAMAKIPDIVALCKDLLLTEDKVVIFAHHRDVVKALAAEFDAACVIGGLTAIQRDNQIQSFKTGDKRVIVGNITAMGSAISLKEADVAVFAELSWIPAEIDQAEERIWDPEKTTPCSIYRVVVEDSIEATIAALLETRQLTIDRMTKAKFVS